MPNPKAYKYKDPKAPAFPHDYDIVKRATLQKTDIEANNNKYYGLELHKANGSFRVFTHYGRTGDLSSNPNAGTKECRFFTNAADAEREYNRLYKAKTGSRKGYVELSLASSNIGSDKARGQSSGHVDEKTAAKIETKPAGPITPKPANICPPPLRGLISLIYDAATTALTTTVQAKITAKGIETPLGVLTVGQIERGELILKQIFEAVQAGDKDVKGLTSQFYTAIPHKLGRTRAHLAASVIDSKAKISEKEETLQLMRDMLQVDGESHNVLVSDELGDKYKALGCQIEHLPSSSGQYNEVSKMVMNTRKGRSISIQNIYQVQRPGEGAKFESIGNERPLFHGSRIKNWVGLLTRGTLMPKLVVAMGGNRTDGGWLGNGIYFGSEAGTSVYYTSPGRNGHRIMTVHAVSLGNMAEFKKITYGMNEPPKGFDSCYGNPNVPGSQFSDNEYCIYNENRQVMNYLVEFRS